MSCSFTNIFYINLLHFCITSKQQLCCVQVHSGFFSTCLRCRLFSLFSSGVWSSEGGDEETRRRGGGSSWINDEATLNETRSSSWGNYLDKVSSWRDASPDIPMIQVFNSFSSLVAGQCIHAFVWKSARGLMLTKLTGQKASGTLAPL